MRPQVAAPHAGLTNAGTWRTRTVFVTLPGMTEIEVFADVACPFTHVGLRRFVERRAAAGRDDIRLRLRAWPLELVNGAPLDPHHIDAEIVSIRAQVAPDLFTGFRVEAFPATSMPALRLAAAAYARDAETGEAVSLALRDALFERGLDIADAAVLAEVAASCGIEIPADEDAAVLAEYADGRQRGVIGSPHFFAGDRNEFCPLLTIKRTETGWDITQDLSMLDQLLAG